MLEQEAIKLEDEKLAKITLVEIGELERDNEKLMLEVRMLKAENGLLRNKVQEFSTSNEELGEQVVMLEEKKKATSKNLEDLAKLSEEFEEENSRRFRKMFIVVEKSTNTVMEFQERLNKKEEELKRTKVKECDFLVQLDMVEQEMKSLQVKHHQGPRIHDQTGSFSYRPLTCYFCAKRGHNKAQCFSFQSLRISHRRYRMYQPKVKQI